MNAAKAFGMKVDLLEFVHRNAATSMHLVSCRYARSPQSLVGVIWDIFCAKCDYFSIFSRLKLFNYAPKCWKDFFVLSPYMLNDRLQRMQQSIQQIVAPQEVLWSSGEVRNSFWGVLVKLFFILEICFVYNVQKSV